MTICTYCHRELTPRSEGGDLAHTRDHIIPKSKGGGKVVPACYACNHRKGDMMPEEWIAFMASNPRWWDHLPRMKRVTNINRPRLKITADENAARMDAYRNRISAPPLEKTRQFLQGAALRALRKDEPIPINYDDPKQQAAFEAVYANRKYLLRVPVNESDTSAPPR